MKAAVTISAVLAGFSYERARLEAEWPELMAWIERQVRVLGDENPDEIMVTIKRPTP